MLCFSVTASLAVVSNDACYADLPRFRHVYCHVFQPLLLLVERAVPSPAMSIYLLDSYFLLWLVVYLVYIMMCGVALLQ